MRKKKVTERSWDYEEEFKEERNNVRVSKI